MVAYFSNSKEESFVSVRKVNQKLETKTQTMSKQISLCLCKTARIISDCNGTRTHNHLVCKRTLNGQFY